MSTLSTAEERADQSSCDNIKMDSSKNTGASTLKNTEARTLENTGDSLHHYSEKGFII